MRLTGGYIHCQHIVPGVTGSSRSAARRGLAPRQTPPPGKLRPWEGARHARVGPDVSVLDAFENTRGSDGCTHGSADDCFDGGSDGRADVDAASTTAPTQPPADTVDRATHDTSSAASSRSLNHYPTRLSSTTNYTTAPLQHDLDSQCTLCVTTILYVSFCHWFPVV